MTAQKAAEIAIAVAETAAAKRTSGAKIELIARTAMIRAIRPPSEILVSAVIAKSRRQ
jgi:hypothetical protein